MEHEKQIINLFKIFIQSITVFSAGSQLNYQEKKNLINLIDKAESEIKIIESKSKPVAQEQKYIISVNYYEDPVIHTNKDCVECGRAFLGALVVRYKTLPVCKDCTLPF